jgi:hypothetical protein
MYGDVDGWEVAGSGVRCDNEAGLQGLAWFRSSPTGSIGWECFRSTSRRSMTGLGQLFYPGALSTPPRPCSFSEDPISGGERFQYQEPCVIKYARAAKPISLVVWGFSPAAHPLRTYPYEPVVTLMTIKMCYGIMPCNQLQTGRFTDPENLQLCSDHACHLT